MKTSFTRAEIESIKVGTKLRAHGRVKEVVKITCIQEDIHGKLFVHGYHQFSDNSTISFSIKEGSDLDYSLYRLAE